MRNLPDGTVEAVFEGDPTSVDALTAWCNEGPPMAHVVKTEVFDEPPTGEVRFSVR